MNLLTILLLSAGAAAGVAGWWLWRRWPGRRALVCPLLWLVAALLLAGGGYHCWYYHRPLPAPVNRRLFAGITYARQILRSPRPMVLHVVTIDLDAPGIRFLVTPEERTDGRQLPASTTSQFLRRSGAQLAVNANYFHPWYADGPLSYYPHVGDPVDVSGLAISRGKPYSRADGNFHTLYFSKDNRVSIGRPAGEPYNAVSGRQVLLEDGRLPATIRNAPKDRPHPRTAAALDATGRKLMLFLVDGRQPNYSEGATLGELARIIRDRGGHTAVNLDGGGSSTLVMQGPGGEPVVLNSPIHGRVPPGRERPVANHLGVFAEP